MPQTNASLWKRLPRGLLFHGRRGVLFQPDEATLDDAIEKLILLRKIERGLQQRESGEGIPQKEIEKRFGASWQK
jgi:hypothetical protein